MIPWVSVVIVLYRSQATLGACLESIRDDVDSGFAELICVDNASPDESALLAQRLQPRARLVRMDANVGFAAGANAGLRSARAPYWLLLNPDALASSGALRQLVAFMDRNERLGAASPYLATPGNPARAPGRPRPSVLLTALEAARLHLLLPTQVRAEILQGPYWQHGDQLHAGWVPGTAMIVRAQAASEVGLMRDELWLYGEDLEWCERMRRSGWRIGSCSTATFLHRPSTAVTEEFGSSARDALIVQGISRAWELLYGPRRRRILARATAGALLLDSLGFRRTAKQRSIDRASARLWLKAAQSQGLSDASLDRW